jgi:hypothetical protein
MKALSTLKSQVFFVKEHKDLKYLAYKKDLDWTEAPLFRVSDSKSWRKGAVINCSLIYQSDKREELN